MSITLLVGTNRPGSNTRKIVNHLQNVYRELGHSVAILDLIELPAELFLPTAYAEKPAAFARFTDGILASSGLHIVTPEYNGSMPGVLKYFIDQLKFPESFEHRPVAFTGLAAGVWGALRSVEQLQLIFGYRNAYIYPDRVFIPGVMQQISAAGELTNEDTVKRLRTQAEGFAAFVKKLSV
jgi:chromate reductase, NAD(P)H dehydrogenase (quinone)